MTPRAFLALPRRERQYCEMYLIAENLKQKAFLDAQKQQDADNQEAMVFDQQTAVWHAEVERRWKQQRGH